MTLYNSIGKAVHIDHTDTVSTVRTQHSIDIVIHAQQDTTDIPCIQPYRATYMHEGIAYTYTVLQAADEQEAEAMAWAMVDPDIGYDQVLIVKERRNNK